VPPTNSNLVLLKLLKKNIKYLSVENGLQTTFDSKLWSKFNKPLKQDPPTFTSTVKQNLKTDNEPTPLLPPSVDTPQSKETQQKAAFNSFRSETVKLNNSKSKSEVKFSKKDLKPDGNSSGHTGGNSRFRSNKKGPKIDTSDKFDLFENWFECWQAKSANVLLDYAYHSAPVINTANQRLKSVKRLGSGELSATQIDANPDLISLEIEIGPSVIMVYGTFLRNLWFIKESFLSWDQLYTDMKSDIDPSVLFKEQIPKPTKQQTVSKPYVDVPYQLASCNTADPRNFRPLSVKLRLAIHNINGHLMMDLDDSQPSLTFPIGFTDRLALELDKVYDETLLQLYVDPINVFILDSYRRNYDKNICQGHLCLSAVQVRGHAMFSDQGRIKTDTLEYAWLLEIFLGDITGSITPIQTQQLVHSLETILTLVMDSEYELKPVFTDRMDPGLPYKYEVVRFSIDLIDIYLIELGTALNVNLYPVRLGLCNSHTDDYAKGLSACVDVLQLKLFLNEASRSEQQVKQYPQMHQRPINQRLTKSKASLFESGLNLANVAKNKTVASSNNSVFLSSLNSSSMSSIDSFDAQAFVSKTANENLINSRTRTKMPDSDDFNYWFECFSFSTGKKPQMKTLTKILKLT